MERLTLNQNQLEQLTNLTSFVFLSHFRQAQTASEVAKALRLPANTVHYHVNRLAEVGLLEVASEQGRSKTYQAVATQFRMTKEQQASYCHQMSQSISTQLRKLERRFAEAAETSYLNDSSCREDPEDSNYVLLTLESSFQAQKYEPVLNLLEVTMSQERYLTFTQKFADLMNELKDRVEPGETCTFALIAFPGRGMMNGSS
ncbi:MAG: helix-turn-helix transcriptional regulator [Trueperaceae bacterium]|nr:helix-turn-helix transcriptional regulator [Trueperaceae bacterium]